MGQVGIIEEDVMPDLFRATPSESETFHQPLQDGEAIFKIEQKLFLDEPSVHVYTKSLNVNGIAIQDSFEKYLEYDAIQSSHLKQALKTPLHFAFSKDEDKQKLEKIRGGKKYFELGSFLHIGTNIIWSSFSRTEI